MPAVPEPDSPRITIRLAIAGVLSPPETSATYTRLLAYLGQTLHQPVEIVQRKTYAEINDVIRSRSVTLALVCSGAYVTGHDEFGMELLAVPQTRGRVTYQSYIIVPADSDITNPLQLRGRTFAFTDPMSNTGKLAPTYLLHQSGETPGTFFKRYIYTYSHDNSIMAVAERLVDGAAVDNLVYEQIVARRPDIATKTRVIHESPLFAIPPVVVHPSLNQELKTELRQIFLGMNKEAAGREILTGLGLDQFVIIDDSDYNSIREMLKAVRNPR